MTTNPGDYATGTTYRNARVVPGPSDFYDLHNMDAPVTIRWAAMLARHLMQEQGLFDWHFDWDRSQKRYGCCHYGPKKITMSKNLVLHRTRERVRNTILHEIAHALTPGHGHDRVWRAMALKLGCDGKRCAEVRPETASKPPWKLVCTDCGSTLKIGFRRTDMSRKVHLRCPNRYQGPRFTASLAWKANS